MHNVSAQSLRAKPDKTDCALGGTNGGIILLRQHPLKTLSSRRYIESGRKFSLVLSVLMLAACGAESESAKQQNPAEALKEKLEQATGSYTAQEGVMPVYGVTINRPVAFRSKPNAEEKVSGYFPPSKAVWVIRPEEEWTLVRFKGLSAWVAREDLAALFTVDEPPVAPVEKKEK